MSDSIRYKFLLNGVEMVSAPNNWDSINMGLRYSEDSRGIIREYTTEIEIYGADFDVIEELFENNSLDTKLPFKIQYSIEYGTFIDAIDAVIVLPRCSLNTHKRVAKVVLEDVSFVGRIYQNQDLAVPLNSTTTIGGDAITPCTDVEIKSLAGSYYENPRILAVEYGAALEFIVAYLSDNSIELSDIWYANLNDYGDIDPEYYGITYQSSFPAPTFRDLFTSLAKLYNLNFCIKKVGSNFVLSIETYSTFYSSTNAFTLSNIESVDISVSSDLIYSKILIGDTSNIYDSVITRSFPFEASYQDSIGLVAFDGFYSFKGVTYNIKSILGGNKTLNLSPAYGYSLNNYTASQQVDKYQLIQFKDDAESETGYSPTNKDLDEVFTVFSQYTETEVYKYQKFEIYSLEQGPASIQNKNVMARYDLIGNIIVPQIAQSTKFIVATMSSDFVIDELNFGGYDTIHPFPFTSTASETYYSMAWDDEKKAFVATDVSNGYSLYRITWAYDLDIGTGTGDHADMTIVIVVELSGTQYIHQISGSYNTDDDNQFSDNGEYYWQLPDNGVKIWMGYVIWRPNGENVVFDITFQDTMFLGVYRQHGTPTTLASASEDSSKVYTIEVQGHVPLSDWMTLFNDPTKQVTINDAGVTRKGWPYDLKYNLSTGEISGRLITDHNNLYSS